MENPHARLVLGMWVELAVRVLCVASGSEYGASMVDESTCSGGFLYVGAVACVVRGILAGVRGILAGVRVPGKGMEI